ncbi:hypothetical protein BDF21DRAFT_467067 [Thamnidium elegans]|nr:hypothetical protein BDF21DRAFT_467067 [Thamnidium elegans]
MNQIAIRTTIIIKFAYHTTYNVEETSIDSTPNTNTTNAGRSSCAVCGSQLHMTKHCPVHP